jgi:N-alpha-acetyltransferase 50
MKDNDIRLSKFAVCKGMIVGAICTRLEDANNDTDGGVGDDITGGGAKKKKRPGRNQRLYIMTLAVSAVYRGRGIGSKLLESILEFCEQNRQSQKKASSFSEEDADDDDSTAASATANISEIALHVQISNQDAIRFYTKQFNFVQGERVDNYYRRIDPPHCYLLYKRFDDHEEQKKNIDISRSAEITSSRCSPDAASTGLCGDDETKLPAIRK